MRVYTRIDTRLMFEDMYFKIAKAVQAWYGPADAWGHAPNRISVDRALIPAKKTTVADTFSITMDAFAAFTIRSVWLGGLRRIAPTVPAAAGNSDTTTA